MSADVSPIAAVFEHCQILGWIPFFQSAAAATSFEPELLLAVGYRESRLDPKYLKVVGDNGHGYGLMQVDSRSYPDCVNAGHWKDANSCIVKGAVILASKRDNLTESIGIKKLRVRTVAGRTYTFDGVPIAEPDLLRLTVASYNCGLWAYFHYSKGRDIDTGTTCQNYSRDVLANAVHFRQLLNPAAARSLAATV